MISGVHTDGFFHSDLIPPIRTVPLTNCTYLVVTSLESIQVEKASHATPQKNKNHPSVRNESILKNWRMRMRFLQMKAWSLIRWINPKLCVQMTIAWSTSGSTRGPRGKGTVHGAQCHLEDTALEALRSLSFNPPFLSHESRHPRSPLKKSPTQQIQRIAVICLTCSNNKKHPHLTVPTTVCHTLPVNKPSYFGAPPPQWVISWAKATGSKFPNQNVVQIWKHDKQNTLNKCQHHLVLLL